MTNKEIFVNARGLIEKGWTQKAYARDANGDVVFPKDPNACEWCAMGALDAANPEGFRRFLELWNLLDNFIDQPLSFTFNDVVNTTQKDVLDLYDRAIEGCHDDD